MLSMVFFLQSLSTARPLVNIYGKNAEEVKGETLGLPAVFKAPIRPDVVNFVHQQISMNHRQAYCVSDKAGKIFSTKFRLLIFFDFL